MIGYSYTINYSDSTLDGKDAFTIEPRSFDGPELAATSPSRSHTSINLLGMGYLFYGERANENFLWLLENFAGSEEPINPTIGQIWFDAGNNVLKVYNKDKEWVSAGGALPPQRFPIVGASVLARTFYIEGNRVNSFRSGSSFLVRGAPNEGIYSVSTAPLSITYNGVSNRTEIVVNSDPLSTSAGGYILVSLQPTLPIIGQLWYDIVHSLLYVYNGVDWQLILSPGADSNVDLQNRFKIINLISPSEPTDATNKQYVDNAISASLGQSGSDLSSVVSTINSNLALKANKAGDTFTGNLTVSNNSQLLFSNGSTFLKLGGSGNIGVEPTISASDMFASSSSNFYVHINENNFQLSPENKTNGSFVVASESNNRTGNYVDLFKITKTGHIYASVSGYESLVDSGPGSMLTNKTYVDTKIDSELTLRLGSAPVPAINPSSAKDGDIKVSGSTIWVFAASSWRQIFPAVYS